MENLMSLLKRIKDDSVVARKERSNVVKIQLLGLVLSRAETSAKDALRETTDADVLDAIKYYRKGAQDTSAAMLKQSMTSDPRFIQAGYEFQILGEYLPAQMTEEEHKVAVRGVVAAAGESFKIGPMLGMLKKAHGDALNIAQAKELLETYHTTWS